MELNISNIAPAICHFAKSHPNSSCVWSKNGGWSGPLTCKNCNEEFCRFHCNGKTKLCSPCIKLKGDNLKSEKPRIFSKIETTPYWRQSDFPISKTKSITSLPTEFKLELDPKSYSNLPEGSETVYTENTNKTLEPNRIFYWHSEDEQKIEPDECFKQIGENLAKKLASVWKSIEQSRKETQSPALKATRCHGAILNLQFEITEPIIFSKEVVLPIGQNVMKFDDENWEVCKHCAAKGFDNSFECAPCEGTGYVELEPYQQEDPVFNFDTKEPPLPYLVPIDGENLVYKYLEQLSVQYNLGFRSSQQPPYFSPDNSGFEFVDEQGLITPFYLGKLCLPSLDRHDPIQIKIDSKVFQLVDDVIQVKRKFKDRDLVSTPETKKWLAKFYWVPV